MQEITYCRMAPSLGALEDTPENIWGTPPYDPEKHADKPCVFFGLYGLSDFYTLWRHRGKKYILWAGSDITHFLNGYWLDDKGEMRLDTKSLAHFINHFCKSYVENQIEYTALKAVGINSQVVPSFLGKMEDYKISYTSSNNPKVYTSVSGNDFELYGWHHIPEMARVNPNMEFHLYGNMTSLPWKIKNIIIHGRVSKEQMNDEIKNMQGALRLTRFDGFSEIVAKSILWGQWPVSLINYPFMLAPEEIHLLLHSPEPNHSGRDMYRSILNKYPWNVKNN